MIIDGTSIGAVATWIAQSLPVNDPIMFFVGQGVLGIVCFILYKDNRELKTQQQELYDKVIDQHIPLLTRATIAIERAAGSMEHSEE